MGLFHGTIIATVFLCRVQVTRLYTRDPTVTKLMMLQWPYMAVMMSQDAIFSNQMGVLKGLGQQAWGSVASFVWLWLYGLTAGWFFSKWWRLEGVWIAMNSAYVMFNFSLFLIISCSNWKKI